MTRRRTLLACLAAVATAGCSSLDGGGSAGTPTATGTPDGTPEPTATPDDGGTATPAGGDATATPEPTATATPAGSVAFAVELGETSECGRTCRTVTYTLGNTGDRDAADVTVGVHVFTGGDRVFDGSHEVGSVPAGEERSGLSKDVDVGLFGGRKVLGNDGQVTVELTPEAGSGASETFTFERQLDL
jgi:hypothetical protein